MAANPVAHAQWPELRALGEEWAAVAKEARDAAFRIRTADAERTPEGGGWSAAQCYVHLSLSTAALLARLEPALAQATEPARRPPRLDFWGRLLCWALDPGRKFKTKTSAPFQPSPAHPWPAPVHAFLELHDRAGRLMAQSVNLDLNRIRIGSPFASALHYNAYSAFRILLVHDRRHQAQARRAAGALS